MVVYKPLAPLCNVAAAAFVGDSDMSEPVDTRVSAIVEDAPADIVNEPVRCSLLSANCTVLKKVSHSSETRPVFGSRTTLSKGRVIGAAVKQISCH